MRDLEVYKLRRSKKKFTNYNLQHVLKRDTEKDCSFSVDK
jgi:hypothetical protein